MEANDRSSSDKSNSLCSWRPSLWLLLILLLVQIPYRLVPLVTENFYGTIFLRKWKAPKLLDWFFLIQWHTPFSCLLFMFYSSTYLILTPYWLGINHLVTPVLFQDLVLLLCKVTQLLSTTLQVCIEAAQALGSPNRCFLLDWREKMLTPWPQILINIYFYSPFQGTWWILHFSIYIILPWSSLR